MNKVPNYHRAFGVYGICIKNNKMLVIDTSKGPYKNRYDLPGGSLEEGESLLAGLHREIYNKRGNLKRMDIACLQQLLKL
ncbi:NUDIX domain-containing protein [Bacillus clarus]|uniref:NUDIX domain protein n=1 Tax=Bacillus clarus TaxID=2338372 RepID=A0A090YXR1_9BACI|nr:NUDIX domain protein [Bacillus clarus]RFT66335.1 NUDIX domain-containing protein [Bacillus clarus]